MNNFYVCQVNGYEDNNNQQEKINRLFSLNNKIQFLQSIESENFIQQLQSDDHMKQSSVGYESIFDTHSEFRENKDIFDNIKNNIEKNTINVNSKRTLAGLYNFDEDADVKFLKENYNLDVFGAFNLNALT